MNATEYLVELLSRYREGIKNKVFKTEFLKDGLETDVAFSVIFRCALL